MVYFDSKFTFTELYSMPTYLRLYYEQKLIENRQRENDEIKKSQQGQRGRK